MSLKRLDFIQSCLYSDIAKIFLQANLVSYSLLNFFVKKWWENISFCVHYMRLNANMKKDCYLVTLVTEILAQ